MIGGIRGDVGDVLHRIGNFFKYRFVLAHNASKGPVIAGLTGAEAAGSRKALTAQATLPC
jgi:hypothetical protein